MKEEVNSMVRLFLGVTLLPVLLVAGITDVIALPDGRNVFFRAKSGVTTYASWLFEKSSDGFRMGYATGGLVDTNLAGDTQAAFSISNEKICGTGGGQHLFPSPRVQFRIRDSHTDRFFEQIRPQVDDGSAE